MKEIWKDIKGYEGIYQVSNLGRVKSLKYNKQRILKPDLDKNGYLRRVLCLNNKIKKFSIHRLVALTFIPNPKDKPQVNHKDGVKTNNFLNNLEWATSKENRIHSHVNNLQNYVRGERCSYAKLTEKQVIEILKIGRSVTQIKLSEKYKVSRRHISDIINRKRWSHVKI